jgi:hypothetical protein
MKDSVAQSILISAGGGRGSKKEIEIQKVFWPQYAKKLVFAEGQFAYQFERPHQLTFPQEDWIEKLQPQENEFTQKIQRSQVWSESPAGGSHRDAPLETGKAPGKESQAGHRHRAVQGAPQRSQSPLAVQFVVKGGLNRPRSRPPAGGL